MKKRTLNKRALIFILLMFGNLLLPSILLNHVIQNKSWIYTLTNDWDEVGCSIAISEDGNYLVVGSENDNLYLFKKWSALPIWTYKMPYNIKCVDISSNGNYIVVGVGTHELYLFDRNSPYPIWSCTLESDICSVSISADGSNIIAKATEIYAFHRSSPDPKRSIPTSGYKNILSKDGKYFGLVDDVSISYYNFESFDPIWTYYAGDCVIPRAALSYNGSYLCAGGQDMYFHFFNNSVTNPKIPIWSYKTAGLIRTVAISSDGKYCIAGTTSGIYAFEKSNPNPIFSNILLGEILSVDISSNGQYFCAGGLENKVYLFTITNSSPFFTYNTKNKVDHVKISEEGNSIIASTGYKLYYFDRTNPYIMDQNELWLNALLISMWILISIDMLPGLIFTMGYLINYIKKLPYRKLEKRKREVEKTYTMLDKEFKEWEKGDIKKESKAKGEF